MYYLRVALQFFISVCIGLVTASSLADGTHYVIHNRGYTATIQAMLNTTIERSLELTRAEYGGFNVTEYGAKLSNERFQQLIAKGESNQLYFSANLTLSTVNKNSIAIDLPFISNVLGLRIIVVKQQKRDIFKQLNSLDDLRALTMGVGHSWSERAIFDANEIPYGVGMLTKSLFPMLEKNRFDYLALGTIDDIESMGYSDFSDLAILDDTMLFYPIPFRLFLRGENPLVTERIKLGVSRFIESGEAETMVKSKLMAHANRIKEQQVRILVIENPFYHAKSIEQSLEDIQRYFVNPFLVIAK